MSLFPDADFEVFLASPGVIVPGKRLEGSLEIRVPEPIPRAQRIELVFRSSASVTYGSGDSERTTVKDLLVVPFGGELDKRRPLPAGPYKLPFELDVPPWLPPALDGVGCSIRHRIDVRLDVDWAKDPTRTFQPKVALPPVDMTAGPLLVRSAPGWHPELVVDVRLEHGTLVEGERIMCELALRGGRDARFDALEVTLAGEAILVMGMRDRRRVEGRGVRIPADKLRSGAAVRFVMDYPKGLPPTFRTGYIDHEVLLEVKAIIPWSSDRSFIFRVPVLPAGSTVRGSNEPRAHDMGSSRLLALGDAMAQATGFSRGRLPVLAEGRAGPIRVRISDGPRAGRMGLDVEFGLPDLDLGIVFRPAGTLELFRESPLLPEPLRREKYFLRLDPDLVEGGPIEVERLALQTFFSQVLADLGAVNEVRLSDHHLGFHVGLSSDGAEDMVQCARAVKARAEAVARAIAALPFPSIHPDAEAAWLATAREQNGFLMRHVPAIHGLVVATRILGGEAREMGVTLRTRHDRTIAADLDLRVAPLPPSALSQLEQGNAVGLEHVRAVFPRCRAHSLEKLTLSGAAFAPDPRTLFSALDAFLGWVLDARGERRTSSAYR